jgi:GxxExxY protein
LGKSLTRRRGDAEVLVVACGEFGRFWTSEGTTSIFFAALRLGVRVWENCLGGIMTENEIGTIVVETAIQIHRDLGPGLLESVYEVILTRLLANRGLAAVRQVVIPFEYAGEHFAEGFRADIVVEGKVILELKAVEKMNKLFARQLLTYLKLADMRLGYVLNFGDVMMKDGIERVVNGL